ncbi:TPA: phage repressor protein CI [Escherichia coli]
MNFKNGGQAVITRMLEAYGFKTRQALCEQFNVSASTMGTRWMRDVFPADWVIQCAIETGASIEWLSFGKGVPFPQNTEASVMSKATALKVQYVPQINNQENPIGNLLNLDSGGRDAIDRLMKAYGFKTRQELADHLNVSKSTMANRYLRDTFPADWIIKCSLETGNSLLWLATGQGSKHSSLTTLVKELPKFHLNAGKMVECGSYIFDTSFLPANLSAPIVIQDGLMTYICDQNITDVLDGHWLINIDETYSIRHITRLPKKVIKVSSSINSFECGFSDINFVARVYLFISSINKSN